uniref:Uncharacterized protein n=1 Tax=Rhizophora mucronata TaxID=61149 RepID=A0A2P2NH54_RHIMU
MPVMIFTYKHTTSCSGTWLNSGHAKVIWARISDRKVETFGIR